MFCHGDRSSDREMSGMIKALSLIPNTVSSIISLSTIVCDF